MIPILGKTCFKIVRTVTKFLLIQSYYRRPNNFLTNPQKSHGWYSMNQCQEPFSKILKSVNTAQYKSIRIILWRNLLLPDSDPCNLGSFTLVRNMTISSLSCVYPTKIVPVLGIHLLYIEINQHFFFISLNF